MVSKEEETVLLKRLSESRFRILCRQGFYGTLLMHIDFKISEKIKGVSAFRRTISFHPDFLHSLNESEVDYVLMHEIVHLSLCHSKRRKECEDKKIFDIAADMVTDSNICHSFDDDIAVIMVNGKIGETVLENGRDAYRYTAEEVYDYLLKNRNVRFSCDEEGTIQMKDDIERKGFDDHEEWEGTESEMEEREWMEYLSDACETVFIKDPSNKRGTIPGFALRVFKEIREGKIDWHILLHNFLREEITDYSFSPPDHRFLDSPFFLPDFNAEEEQVKNILFMVDASGSMSDAQITTAYSEVVSAIEQFGGKMEGWIGFFDAAITVPKPFSSIEDLKIIRPFGGGGTDFFVVFSYIRDKMKDKEIASIVILTDGFAPFPDESVSDNIPVLWLINNEKVTPPWGKIARIKEEGKELNYN